MEEKDAKDVKGGGAGRAWPFLIGAAVGAGLGVLFAPEPGEESRRKLARWIKEKREKGEWKLLSKKEQVEAAIDAGRKAYKDTKKELLGV